MNTIMKYLAALVVVFSFAFTMVSCEKCIECSYTYDGQTITSGETCGRRVEIDEIRKEWEKDAEVFNTTAECIDL